MMIRGLLIAAGLAVLASTVAGCNPDAIPKPCTIFPHGQIGDRWTDEDRNGGPIGCATEAEHDAPGQSGRLQSFEHGQISWSPGQNLTTAGYLTGRTAHVDWKPASHHYTYAKFLVRWNRDGREVNQRDTAGGEKGSFTIDLAQDGTYSFEVEGCDPPAVLSDLGQPRCLQHWTVPVAVTLGRSTAADACPAAKPAIAVKYGNGAFTVTGNGFVPNHVVHIRVTNAGNLVRVEPFDTNSNASCAINTQISFAINGTQNYVFAANDERQFDHDTLWSNYFPITAGSAS